MNEDPVEALCAAYTQRKPVKHVPTGKPMIFPFLLA